MLGSGSDLDTDLNCSKAGGLRLQLGFK